MRLSLRVNAAPCDVTLFLIRLLHSFVKNIGVTKYWHLGCKDQVILIDIYIYIYVYIIS